MRVACSFRAQVSIRIRPLIKREIENGDVVSLNVTPTELNINGKDSSSRDQQKKFTFDCVLDLNTSQGRAADQWLPPEACISLRVGYATECAPRFLSSLLFIHFSPLFVSFTVFSALTLSFPAYQTRCSRRSPLRWWRSLCWVTMRVCFATARPEVVRSQAVVSVRVVCVLCACCVRVVCGLAGIWSAAWLSVGVGRNNNQRLS